MYLVAVAANEDGNNQRTASYTELHGHGHAGNGDGQRAKDDTKDDAHEDGGNVGRIQAAHRVAHLVGHAVDSVLGTYHHNLVAHLHGQRSRCKQVHAVTGYTGHIHTVYTREVHRGQRLAVHLRIGNENTLRHQGLVLLLKVDVELGTYKGHDSLLVGLSTDNEHLVADVEQRVAVGNTEFAIVDET